MQWIDLSRLVVMFILFASDGFAEFNASSLVITSTAPGQTESPSSETELNQSLAPVDYVLVKKSERKLFLYAGPDLVKSYNIALGKQPVGQKQKEGDSRTPEGLYTLDWRNPNSKFYRSIHVSYPNISQKRSAKEAGIDPGGEIMIHGQPNDWSERIRLTFADKDWTEGCIALENQDMIEVWDLVKDGTPIEIKP